MSYWIHWVKGVYSITFGNRISYKNYRFISLLSTPTGQKYILPKGLENVTARPPPSSTYFSYLIAVLCINGHIADFLPKNEGPNAVMLILIVLVKSWYYSSVKIQKHARPKWPSNTISLHCWYNNSVRNIKEYLWWCLWHHFRRFAPENLTMHQSTPYPKPEIL